MMTEEQLMPAKKPELPTVPAPIKTSVLEKCLEGLRKQIREEKYDDRRERLKRIKRDIKNLLQQWTMKKAA